MFLTSIFLLLLRAVALPLDPMSTITMRTLTSTAANGPPTYKPIILEEWSQRSELLQTWTPNCTLAGISTEMYTEGLLRSRYPYLEGIWFLCRDVPVGAPFSYSPAPVVIMNIEEFGDLRVYSTDNTTYPNGTTVNSVFPFYNETLGANIFYLMGGGAPISYPNPARPLVPRIRVDYVPRSPPAPPNFAGPLASLTTSITPSGLTIMTDSLYMPSMVTNFSITSPVVYLMGTENSLPSALRTPFRPSLFTFTTPQMLSFWSFPLLDIMWYTYFSLVPMIARSNFNTIDPTQQTLTFPLPTSSSSGTLGGSSWRVVSGKYDMNNVEIVYISNGTMIMQNTLENLRSGIPFSPFLFTPTGWRFTDAYARSPNQLPPIFPSPSAAPTPTPTRTVSRSASRSPSQTASQTSAASPSRTPTSTATSSITPSVSVSATSTVSLTSSPSMSSTKTITPSSSETQTRTPSTSLSPSVSSSMSSTYSPSISPFTVPSSTSTITPTGTISMTPSTSVTPSISSSSRIPPPPPNENKSTSTAVSVGVGTGVSVAAVAVLGAFGFFAFRRIPGLRTFYTRRFGTRAPKTKMQSYIKQKPEQKEVEISQNPFLISQARAAQLREMQENMQLPMSRPRSVSKTKKEFNPNMIKKESIRGVMV